jgi:hypothetical protein
MVQEINDGLEHLRLAREPPRERVDSARGMTDLAKLYTEDKQYGGDMYDALLQKLPIFYDLCEKAGITADRYDKVFSLALKGRASTFYYNRIVGRQYDFHTMVEMVKQHFETEERRQQYLEEWGQITLSKVIKENPTKNCLECLEIVLDLLIKIQPGLADYYRTEQSIRDQLVNACRGIAECNYALYKPATNYESLCAELRSAVALAMRERQEQQARQYLTEPELEYEAEQHWTDRTYSQRGRSQHSNYRGYRGRNQRGSGRGSYRGEGRRYREETPTSDIRNRLLISLKERNRRLANSMPFSAERKD